MNNIAQLVEVVHLMVESLEMIDQLLDNSMDDL